MTDAGDAQSPDLARELLLAQRALEPEFRVVVSGEWLVATEALWSESLVAGVEYVVSARSKTARPLIQAMDRRWRI